MAGLYRKTSRRPRRKLLIPRVVRSFDEAKPVTEKSKMCRKNSAVNTKFVLRLG